VNHGLWLRQGGDIFSRFTGTGDKVTGSFTKALKLFELCESLKEH
jgi:hypothetical protein